jgi:Ca2+-binding RTX toxin-like protein
MRVKSLFLSFDVMCLCALLLEDGYMANINGGDGHDTLNGTADADLIRGGLGLDRINGEGGNDTISGGHNSDRIYGGAGDDLISGGDGFDQLYGNSGNDLIRGGTHADLIWGDSGHDTLSGDGGVIVCMAVPAMTCCLVGSATTSSQVGRMRTPYWVAPGTDTLDGGAGFDMASYAAEVTAVTVFLDAGDGTSSGAAAGG